MCGNVCVSCGSPLQAVMVQSEKQPAEQATIPPQEATISSQEAAPSDDPAESPDKRNSAAMPQDSVATQPDSLQDTATLPDGDTLMEEGRGNGLGDKDAESDDGSTAKGPEVNAEQLALMLQLMTQRLQVLQPDHPALNQHWVSDPSAQLQLAVPAATAPATGPAAAPSPAPMVSEPNAQNLPLPAVAESTAAPVTENAPLPIPAPPQPDTELALVPAAPAKAPGCGPPPKAAPQAVPATPQRQPEGVINSKTHPTEWATYRRFCERNEWAGELRTAWQPLSQFRQKQHSNKSLCSTSFLAVCSLQCKERGRSTAGCVYSVRQSRLFFA